MPIAFPTCGPCPHSGSSAKGEEQGEGPVRLVLRQAAMSARWSTPSVRCAPRLRVLQRPAGSLREQRFPVRDQPVHHLPQAGEVEWFGEAEPRAALQGLLHPLGRGDAGHDDDAGRGIAGGDHGDRRRRRSWAASGPSRSGRTPGASGRRPPASRLPRRPRRCAPGSRGGRGTSRGFAARSARRPRRGSCRAGPPPAAARSAAR